MLVRMVAARVLQEAGRERPLSRGEAYDLADPVAAALIATGVATAVVQTSALEDVSSDDTRAQRPPEGRPLASPETKESRRTRA